MEDMQQGWNLVGIPLCLAGAALAVVTQISVRALGQERILELIESGQAGRALRNWLDAPLRLLISIQVARVGLVALATWMAAELAQGLLGRNAAFWTAVGVPLFHIAASEVVLATWAKHRPTTVAERALTFFLPVDWLLWPLSAPLAAAARKVAGMLTGGDAQARESGPFLMEADLARLVGLAPEAGQPQDSSHRMLQGVLEFHDVMVRDVMIPRTRMTALDVDAPAEEIARTFSRHGFTRMPVFQGSMDQVVGILFMADVLAAISTASTLNVRGVMRRPYFVPELMKVEDLLREFQKRRTHLAVVVDEFGGPSGMVTLQDVVEEIIGDVRDEKTVSEQSIKEVQPGLWIMDGRTSIDAASAALGEELPWDGGYETLGGFLITRMGRLPGAGTSYKHGKWLMVVKEADERRIQKIQVERVEDAARKEGEPAAE